MEIKKQNNHQRNEPFGNAGLIKYKSSLTKRKLELLEYANLIALDIKEVKFGNVNQHGTLKSILNQPVNQSYFYPFNTRMQLAEIIVKIGHAYLIKSSDEC